jgi:integrase/recombinase XerD
MNLEDILGKTELPPIPDAAPVITIFVRHSPSCKYAGDEFSKRCNCKKHFRWTQNGKQYRRKSGARTWEEADRAKRRLEDSLSGRPASKPKESAMLVADAVKTFMQAKKNDGLEPPTIQKLQKTCERIQNFAERSGAITLDGITLVHLTTWPWDKYFGTTHSLRTNQERVKSFFRYFHNAGVIAKNPAAAWKRVTGRVEQVSGFSEKEYKKIIETVQKSGDQKLLALVQLMRFGGLAIIDAACLERSQIIQRGKNYRIRLASRQKTSKKAHRQMIDNAIPPAVGRALVSVLNGNPRYVFWNREGEAAATDAEKRDAVKYWQKQVRALLNDAGLPNATSHKFRHTLAIEMIRHGATFEDVAAALGNTVGVVAKFYSHEWAKVRQGRTDKAIKAAW